MSFIGTPLTKRKRITRKKQIIVYGDQETSPRFVHQGSARSGAARSGDAKGNASEGGDSQEGSEGSLEDLLKEELKACWNQPGVWGCQTRRDKSESTVGLVIGRSECIVLVIVVASSLVLKSRLKRAPRTRMLPIWGGRPDLLYDPTLCLSLTYTPFRQYYLEVPPRVSRGRSLTFGSSTPTWAQQPRCSTYPYLARSHSFTLY
ncbi:hypothetical protein BGW80DRAFT_1294852 [Lactifluus volemus]|nr:hypothetical protein BGW80DRAFT_1294852 [Lactifluus volemus]